MRRHFHRGWGVSRDSEERLLNSLMLILLVRIKRNDYPTGQKIRMSGENYCSYHGNGNFMELCPSGNFRTCSLNLSGDSTCRDWIEKFLLPPQSYCPLGESIPLYFPFNKYCQYMAQFHSNRSSKKSSLKERLETKGVQHFYHWLPRSWQLCILL